MAKLNEVENGKNLSVKKIKKINTKKSKSVKLELLAAVGKAMPAKVNVTVIVGIAYLLFSLIRDVISLIKFI